MKTQAWGWLLAAVLAAGLNASYHDGGLAWARHISGRVGHNAAAVLALASGNADQFLMEARYVVTHNEISFCRFGRTRAQVQASMAESQAEFDRLGAMSASEQAQLARAEADHLRMQAQLAANASRLHLALANFNPTDFGTIETPACPRVRVHLPRVPMIKVPSPVFHFNISGPGPI